MKYDRETYTRNYESGEFSGFGKYFYSNGDRYEGNWKNDKKNGFGEYFWNDGRRYEGNWENSERSGSGYFFGLMVIDLKEIGRKEKWIWKVFLE